MCNKSPIQSKIDLILDADNLFNLIRLLKFQLLNEQKILKKD